jgi:NitT/TauT family transport system ATP-binding protein
MKKTILEFNSVDFKFNNKTILHNINFALKEQEIVALIGKSGSGKSTILKIIAGLIEQSKGDVKYTNSLQGDKISMVFQNFALLPWLTVEENISVVLEAKHIPSREVKNITSNIIELIGLSGYEMAYPRELSGGMKQRVGIARALVVKPEIMLMDEPFSALDVLTANTLKSDLIDLWLDNKIPLKSILIVTHNIEEAVMLADRIFILSSNPGTIISEIEVGVKRPRSAKDTGFSKCVEKVYSSFILNYQDQSVQTASIYYRVPFFFPNTLHGLVEYIYNNSGKILLSSLEGNYDLTISDIVSATSFLQLLKFVSIENNEVSLTSSGKILSESGIQERKQIFSEHLMQHLPIISYICDTLKERKGHKAPKKRFMTLLEDQLSHSEAIESLKAITNWGRYTELFFYNDKTGQYYLNTQE